MKMKVIVNIDESTYEYWTRPPMVSEYALAEALVNGTPIPDNATNGDIVKAMFPNIEADEIKTDTGGYIEVKYLDTTDECDATAFRKNWWNTPYTEKRGDENE